MLDAVFSLTPVDLSLEALVGYIAWVAVMRCVVVAGRVKYIATTHAREVGHYLPIGDLYMPELVVVEVDLKQI